MKHFCCVCGKEGKFDKYTCPDCTETEPQPVEEKRFARCKDCGRTCVGKRWLAIESDAEPNTRCYECTAAMGDYYEAIIQFRAEEFPKEQIEELFERMMQNERKRSLHVEITKVVGTSYYFTKVKVAKKIARAIAKIYGIRPKETKKLVGFYRDKGKGKYRFTIFLDLDASRIEK